jgi:hypothetical protein
MLMKMTVVAVCCAFLMACDADTLGYVEKTKYDALQRQYEKAESDLKAVQQQVSECQTHKYQIYKSGWRTWRLDSVTGATCILLTTDAEWKKPEIAAQGCY